MTDDICRDTPRPRLEDCRENFRDGGGNAFVVRCPACRRENYALSVAAGQCAWCGWEDAGVSSGAGAPGEEVS